jgi:hypothetical protein
MLRLKREVEDFGHKGTFLFIVVGADLALGTDQPKQGLIRPFASSIGHNHGLFDEA